MVWKYGRTALVMQDNTYKGKNKVKGYLNELMGVILKGNFMEIIFKDKDFMSGVMGGSIKGNEKIIK